jgi:MFS family permease
VKGRCDGGWHAWTIVLGSWCAMIPSMGLLNTLAVLEAWLTENELKDVPKSTTGWIFSCYAFFLYFCGAQVGPIFDAYDIKVLIIPGSIGIVLSLIFLSFSTGECALKIEKCGTLVNKLNIEFYQILLSFGVLGGMSASLLFNPSLAAIGQWFYKRRAFATGVACTAGGLGGVAFPLIIQELSPRIGFPWAIRIVAFICAVHLSVACLCLRKRLPPNKKSGASVDLKALRETNFALTTVGVFLIEFAVFIPYTYICSYAIHAGMSHSDAYRLNAFLNAGAVPGRALPGYVADKFGVFNTMCITSLACTAFILGLWQESYGSETRITVFAVLFGFFSGAAISLTPVCVGQVCKVEDLGKRNGTAFFVASFGALVGVPIAAAVLEANGGDYSGLIWFGGAFYLVASIAFCVARGVAGGWKMNIF